MSARSLALLEAVTAYSTGYCKEGKKLVWLVKGYVGKDWEDKWWIRWAHRAEQEDVGPFKERSEAVLHALRVACNRDCYCGPLRKNFTDTLLRS